VQLPAAAAHALASVEGGEPERLDEDGRIRGPQVEDEQ
jgi:hypothetical protein